MDKELLAFKEERLVVEMSREQKDKLRQYAEVNRVTMSTAVRLILAEVLSENLQKKRVNR